MSNFTYTGIDKTGKRVQGSIEAKNLAEVRKALRAQGVRPKNISTPSILNLDITSWLVQKGIAQPFSSSALLHFTKQLSIMINAGVPILQTLEILYKTEKNISLKVAIKNIAEQVGQGKTLFESMSSQKGFDRLYCNLVKAGETGGILDSILNKIAENLERQEKIKSQIKSALTYPIIVVFVSIAVIMLMLIFVVPKFAEMIKETGQEMPWITQVVISSSSWLGSNALYVIGAIFLGSALLASYVRTPTGKALFDRLSMKLPIIKDVVIKGNLGSFTRTLSTMLSSGVPLTDSLEICADTIDNGIIAKDVRKVRAAVVQGKTLTEPIRKLSYYPDMIAQMVKVGEQTGNLDQMLVKISEVFEDNVKAAIEVMTKLIEPFILLFLGGIIAAILAAMYMPIFMSAGGSF